VHTFLERMQLEHAGRFSSHLILLSLQLWHPVFTFGLLVLARFGFCEGSAVESLVAAGSAPFGVGAGARCSDDIAAGSSDVLTAC